MNEVLFATEADASKQYSKYTVQENTTLNLNQLGNCRQYRARVG